MSQYTKCDNFQNAPNYRRNYNIQELPNIRLYHGRLRGEWGVGNGVNITNLHRLTYIHRTRACAQRLDVSYLIMACLGTNDIVVAVCTSTPAAVFTHPFSIPELVLVKVYGPWRGDLGFTQGTVACLTVPKLKERPPISSEQQK